MFIFVSMDTSNYVLIFGPYEIIKIYLFSQRRLVKYNFFLTMYITCNENKIMITL